MLKSEVINLIQLYCSILNFNPEVATAVAKVESNFNPNAVGQAGEVGIYQLLPQYVNDATRKHLKDPHVNIILGIKRLIDEKKYCKHKEDINYLTCYNLGREAAKKIKHPEKFPYVRKVKREMKNYYAEIK